MYIFFIGALIVSCIPTGVHYLGYYTASKKENYMVIIEEENFFIVVTSYKDSMILAPYDLEKELITPTYKAIEIKELKDARMVHFENGLKVK
jgi:hypothetical protein